MIPATPNPSESPTSSQELTAVLRKIAEIEGRPGYEGPTISEELNYFECVQVEYDEVALDFDLPEGCYVYPSIPKEWFGDVVVGTIARAVRRGDNQDGAEMGFEARINGMFSATITFWRWGVMQKVIRRFGDSLALAAANAYLAAIQEGEL